MQTLDTSATQRDQARRQMLSELEAAHERNRALEDAIRDLLREWDKARGGPYKRCISGSVSQARIDQLRAVLSLRDQK